MRTLEARACGSPARSAAWFGPTCASRSTFQDIDPGIRYAEAAVMAAFRVSAGDLHSPMRGAPQAAQARQMVAYLAHVSFGLESSQLAACLSRDSATVRHAWRAVEERRDDWRLDAALTWLERGMLRLRWAVLQAEAE